MPVVEEPRVLLAEDGSATRGGGGRSDVGGLEEEPRARIRERMLGDTCAGWCVVLAAFPCTPWCTAKGLMKVGGPSLVRVRQDGGVVKAMTEATWPPYRNLLKGKSIEDGAGAAGDQNYIDPVEL